MPPLRDFGYADPDFVAACQQGALVWCLYADRKDLARVVTGPAAVELDWQWRPESWPPSFQLWHTPPDTYWIAITGTTDLTNQGPRHLLGQWWLHEEADGSIVHAPWWEAANTLYGEIRPQLPDDLSAVRIRISGHSYGGAVAQLLGDRLAADTDQTRVQVLTFGQPAARRNGYVGPTPAVYWRINSTLDVVPSLPVNGPIYGLSTWTVNNDWVLAWTVWEQYGRFRTIGWDGSYSTYEAPPDPLPTQVSVGLIAEHKGRNYYGRMNQRLARIQPDPEAGLALSIWRDAIFSEATQATAPRLPETTQPPDAPAPVPIPEPPPPVKLTPRPQPSRSRVMAAPAVPISVGPNQRIMVCSQVFALGNAGWTENWPVLITDSADPYLTGARWLAEMNAVRRLAMASEAAIVAIRVWDPDHTRDAYLKYSPNYGAGNGLAGGDAAYSKMAWTAKVIDSTSQVGNIRYFRGWPKSAVPWTPANNGIVFGAVAIVDAFFLALAGLVIPEWTDPTDPASKLQCVIESYDHTTPEQIVTSIGSDDNGYIHVMLEPLEVQPSLYRVGDFVHLRHKRKRCVRGVAGDANVISVTAGSEVGPFTIGRRPCCGDASLAGLEEVFIQRRTPSYYDIASIDAGRIVTKKVGAPFGQPVGRASARCC